VDVGAGVGVGVGVDVGAGVGVGEGNGAEAVTEKLWLTLAVRDRVSVTCKVTVFVPVAW
jgi:hypothetical protein